MRTLRTAAAVGAGYAALQVMGRRAGATPQERKEKLPGDALVTQPQLVTDHAITIDAPPDRVWPWLTQMGWHLGGYYTPAWVDRLFFPANWQSLDRIDPALVRHLQEGDRIPDGPPGTAEYVVHIAPAPHVLELRSRTHIPPGWEQEHHASLLWTWCFVLSELPGERTRLHIRMRGHTAPWWLTLLYAATIVPADLLMASGMLHGLKRRVEADRPPRPSGRIPVQGAGSPEAVEEREPVS